ncbi:NAD(P)/FAD-dependent oxidoreductase [Amycolatopsis saalfeldensis]|uniref:Reductase C-terminal n=1 Tax=Amycolatopsis saalfeldensis TaxID=394193 RepID=A0A1H8YFK4_9PSEU|nr:FAD-dependent oxidoreductase [Amycolatopsis saalfeldensis]SEP50925.1 Reductase C-terminal [Amycolatopsis saalfeldensis]
MERIVIAGAGPAGLRAAERLREIGFGGQVTIVGEEPHKPYHRPALSEQLLTGEWKQRDLGVPAYTELGARWRLNCTARRLDPARRVVELAGGEELGYDGLIIATGVEPRRVPGIPWHDPRVHVLRTLGEANALAAGLAATKGRVAVIGTGFTGCELASTLREMNREVTLIGRSPTLCGKALGPRLAGTLADLHAGHGVDLALGVEIRVATPTLSGIVLVLSDDRLVIADCVVVSVGSLPGVSWLRSSGLTLDDGILCESTCHVSGAADVVAAGDVACWPNLRFDAVPRRVEHWINAVEMGRAAAESLISGRAGARAFTPLPRFWSEQHKVRIQGAGMPSLADQSVRLGLPAGRAEGSVTLYTKAGQTVGVVGLDQPRTTLELFAELDRQFPADHATAAKYGESA